MTISRRRFISITAGMAIGGIGLAANSAPAQAATWRGVALGAAARLVINGLPKMEAERLITLARNEIERLENIFSIYRPQSSLSVLNATGLLALPPAEVRLLFSKISLIHAASEGKFDPTVQPLWAAYAAHAGQPPNALVGDILARVGWQHVRSDVQRVSFTKPDMALTLNGIAQGFITDRVTQLLKAEGVTSAVVQTGEISAIGRNLKNEPWQVGIAQWGDGPAEDFVSLDDRAIATSSSAGTTFNGKTSHIIDPVNGQPARSTWKHVSVIHESAAIADGISTAAVLMNQSQIENMLAQTSGIQLIAMGNNGKKFVSNS